MNLCFKAPPSPLTRQYPLTHTILLSSLWLHFKVSDVWLGISQIYLKIINQRQY